MILSNWPRRFATTSFLPSRDPFVLLPYAPRSIGKIAGRAVGAQRGVGEGREARRARRRRQDSRKGWMHGFVGLIDGNNHSKQTNEQPPLLYKYSCL